VLCKMGEMIRHNCGLCVASTLHDVYSFGKSIQHRGREATGIAAVGIDRIDVVKWVGPINRFDITDLYKLFPGSNYHTYMLHVRYATKGRKDKILEDAHPHVIGGEVDNRGDHILIYNCEIAGVHNGQVDLNLDAFKSLSQEKCNGGCDTKSLLNFYFERGEEELLRKIPLSYTMVIADKRKNKIIVLRDRTGIKPGVLFWKDGRYGIASEDIAPRKNGGEYIEDLQPGAIYYLYPDSNQPIPIQVVSPSPSFCFFEWNYISDVDSIINGVSVRRVREMLGEKLAEEFNFKEIDLVSFVPRCPEVAARTYAKKLGVQFLPIFYKMRKERSFMGSDLDERKNSISKNLYILPAIKEKLDNSSIVLIDDSFVRGNVLRRISDLFEQFNTKEVHVISYTPPIGIIDKKGEPRGCYFGVDMPPSDQFLIKKSAGNKSEEEINNEFGKKIKIHYLSLKGMLEVYTKLGISPEKLCTYCLGGDLPLPNLTTRPQDNFSL
jgi:glutamine phosphoribosylpyrophosphate amidotransferase